jgi:hypothetical protein
LPGHSFTKAGILPIRNVPIETGRCHLQNQPLCLKTGQHLHLRCWPLLGLFRKLPEPDSDWPAAGRLKWLQTAANIFDLVYKGDGGVTVGLARAERSPRPHDE